MVYAIYKHTFGIKYRDASLIILGLIFLRIMITTYCAVYIVEYLYFG